MKPYLRLVCAHMAIAGLAFLSLPALAGSISIESSETRVAVGDAVFLDVRIDLDLDEILSAFDFDLSFEDSAFNFISASFVDPATGANQLDLPEVGAFGFVGDAFPLGGGVLDVFGVSGNTDNVLNINQVDNFLFARLEFRAIAEIISSPFSLITGDPSLAFLGADFLDLDIAFAPGVTTVSVGSSVAVPEPGTIWLLLAAMPALLIVSHLRSRRGILR